MLRIQQAVKKIQKGLFHLIGRKAERSNSRLDKGKEGYFPVLTVGNNELRKFQVALYYLRHPAFVKLLDAAAQEFGFDQPGVLIIPCEAIELQRILS